MTGTFHEIKNRARPTLSRRVVNFGNSIRQKSTDHAKKLIDMVIPSSSPVNCPQVRCALGLSQNCVIIQVDTKKKNGCPEYPCGKKICGPDGTSHFSQPKLTDKLKLDKWEDCVGGAEQACNSLCGVGNVDYEEESRKKMLNEENTKEKKKTSKKIEEMRKKKVKQDEEDLKAAENIQKKRAEEELKASEAQKQRDEESQKAHMAHEAILKEKERKDKARREELEKKAHQTEQLEKAATEKAEEAKKAEVAAKKRLELAKKELDAVAHRSEVRKKAKEADERKQEEAEKQRKSLLPDPHGKCVEIKGGEKIGCASDSYFGTIEGDYSMADVKTASDKLMQVLPMLSMLGVTISDDCRTKIMSDVCETALPPCTETCQPTKTCAQSCRSFQSSCVSFKDSLQMISKKGSFRSYVSFVGLKEGTKSMAVIDAWIEKMMSCDGKSVSTKPNCIGEGFKGKCNPGVMRAAKSFLETGSRPVIPTQPVKKCENIACDFKGCSNSEYFGTVAEGASPKSVKSAVEKFNSLIKMAGPMIGLTITEKCMGVFASDLVETMLPRCSDKCKPLKTCKSACTEMQRTCLGNGLKGQLQMAMGMGSIVDSFLGTSAPLIKSWVTKLTSCSGDSISSSSTECLSPTYNAPMCDPTVTTGPVTTKTQVIATTEAPVEATTLPRACCKAMTKTCLACAAGITVETYCAKNPGKFGCPRGQKPKVVVLQGELFCPVHMPFELVARRL